MKKTRLKIDYDFSFSLLGIVTGLKEYKLAWKLNQTLDIKLIKQEDVNIPMVDGQDLVISNLLYETENSSIRLLGNRSVATNERSANLLPELPNFTHFFLLQDEGDAFELSEIVDKIKSIQEIDYVLGIEPEKLKNKDNLIF